MQLFSPSQPDGSTPVLPRSLPLFLVSLSHTAQGATIPPKGEEGEGAESIWGELAGSLSGEGRRLMRGGPCRGALIILPDREKGRGEGREKRGKTGKQKGKKPCMTNDEEQIQGWLFCWGVEWLLCLVLGDVVD